MRLCIYLLYEKGKCHGQVQAGYSGEHFSFQAVCIRCTYLDFRRDSVHLKEPVQRPAKLGPKKPGSRYRRPVFAFKLL